MRKYLIPYDEYDELEALLGPNVPHESNLNVKVVTVELTMQEYKALIGAGLHVEEDNYKISLLGNPPTLLNGGGPPPVYFDYFKIPPAITAGFTGTGVKIAVLDSGYTAYDQTVVTAINFGNGTNADVAIDSGFPYGHGTIMCNVLVGKTGVTNYGICPGAEVISIGCLLGGHTGTINALNYCIANNVDIINISLDLGYGLALYNAIQACLDVGIIVCCASGNNSGQSIKFPAACPGVIAVNTVVNSNPSITVGSYLIDNSLANTRNPVTIVNYYKGIHAPFNVGGTSQASAQAVGILAHYKQKYPSLNCAKAICLIQCRALEMDNYSYTLPSMLRSGKKLNLETGAGFLAPIN